MKPNLDLDAELAALPTCSRAELRQRWTSLTGKPAPKVSAALMRMALGAELQTHVYGGLSSRTEQRLTKAAGMSEAGATPPRQRLMREWKGVLHTVTIEADETIRWQGKRWRSLSEVARAITGTRWSGPAFFGLKQKKAA
ncbi:DUF2924 domain-containing protein [Altericroceibacterium xinjiangense]|uniref:DUF2924 domain-containing protein n=1 Tax=Altericroceibacterium xinjiangense TaxID=762261 RepID=UPI001F49D465|nr:DUF2924 domain-containing protein [Altericroceibacterium xinjiangense]